MICSRFLVKHIILGHFGPRNVGFGNFWPFLATFVRNIFAEPPFTFKNRESDVYVATYPKCGTTWTIAIVNNLQGTVPEYGLSLGITCHSCPWVTEHAFLDTWEKSLEYSALKIEKDLGEKYRLLVILVFFRSF